MYFLDEPSALRYNMLKMFTSLRLMIEKERLKKKKFSFSEYLIKGSDEVCIEENCKNHKIYADKY